MTEEGFAERLKTIRNERGYSQEKLAEISTISIKTVQSYEQGKTKPLGLYLLLLAQSLDVTPEYLLVGENHMNSYANAIKKELKQLKGFKEIQTIKNTELNSVVLSHLEMSEELVTEVKKNWEDKEFFKREVKNEDGNEKVVKSYCTRNYVREIILRYCQNRSLFREQFGIMDGNLV